MIGEPLKIFVVDDDYSFRKAVIKVLTANGYHVVEEPRALSVIKDINRERPDLILLDLKMQEAGGVEIVKTMRRMHIDIPVVVISGYLNQKDVQILNELGVKHFLAKPVQLQVLLDTIKNVIKLEGAPSTNRNLNYQ